MVGGRLSGRLAIGMTWRDAVWAVLWSPCTVLIPPPNGQIQSPKREPTKQFIARILAASKNEVVDEVLVAQAQAIGMGLLRQLLAGEVEFPALLMGLGVAQGALLAMADEACAFGDSPTRMVDVHDRLELFRLHALETYRTLTNLR
jgi:hypothetical protein